MINALKRGALAVAFGAGLGLAAVTPAAADNDAAPSGALARCPSGYICLFQHAQYDGDAIVLDRAQAGLRAYNFNDRASSICNATSVLYKFWQHDNYQGYVAHLNPGRCYPNMQNVKMGPYAGVNFNDEVSSFGR